VLSVVVSDAKASPVLARVDSALVAVCSPLWAEKS